VSLLDTTARITERGQYERVDGVLLDLQTAHAINTVARELSPEARAKLDRLEPSQAAAICWRLVS
jgi:hypothetical protein